MPRVLIIEDDERIRESLTRRLADHGFETATAHRAMVGVEMAVADDFDVVVLDLGLPDLDGTKALGMIRAVSAVPVIVATARNDEGAIVALLDAGADDYVTKPFSAEHLAARIRAVLRRSEPDAEDRVIVVGDLTINLDSRRAWLGDEELDLRNREFDMLAFLAERSGQVVRKRELLAAVWHQPYGGPYKTIDVHLSWLRKKLGETAAEPRYLRSVRGLGVGLVDPGE